MLDVALGAVVGVDDPADAVAHGGVRGHAEHALDLLLQGVLQLLAAPREELDAVVGGRVVAGGEHHAEVGTELAGEMGDRRGGEHPHAHHVHAGAGQTGDDGGLQELAGGARVTADHGLGSRSVPAAGQHPRRRDGQFQGEGGGQVLTGDTAYTICSEQPSHRRSAPFEGGAATRRR